MQEFASRRGEKVTTTFLSHVNWLVPACKLPQFGWVLPSLPSLKRLQFLSHSAPAPCTQASQRTCLLLHAAAASPQYYTHQSINNTQQLGSASASVVATSSGTTMHDSLQPPMHGSISQLAHRVCAIGKV